MYRTPARPAKEEPHVCVRYRNPCPDSTVTFICVECLEEVTKWSSKYWGLYYKHHGMHGSSLAHEETTK